LQTEPDSYQVFSKYQVTVDLPRNIHFIVNSIDRCE